MNELAGRVAIVTGAARGIGAAIVRDLAARGAHVVAADNGASIDGRIEDPALIVALAQSCGEAVVPLAQSVAAPEFADAAVTLARERFGGLDIVVNNAAILRDAFLFKCNRADFEAVAAVDLTAAYKTTALSVPPEPVGRFTSFLCSAHAAHITGQVFGVRGRETFVFSQPRPLARATTPADPSLDDLAVLVGAEFASHFTALESDLDAFSTFPVL